MLEESLNIALNTANEFIKKIRDNQDFEELAKLYNLIVLDAQNVKKDGTGSEGILNTEALNELFKIKNGQITKAIKYNDNTYIIAKVENIIPVKEINQSDLLELNLNISKDISSDIQELFINNLSNKQKIKINDRLLNSLFQNNS